MLIDDYIRISAKLNQRLYNRTYIVLLAMSIVLIALGMSGNRTFGQLVSGGIIGYGIAIASMSIRLVFGAKSALRKAAEHPDNSTWFERRAITVSTSGIESQNDSGRRAFSPWSLTKRWENSDEHGITIFFAALEFMFIPAKAMSRESREFICRHLSTYAKGER